MATPILLEEPVGEKPHVEVLLKSLASSELAHPAGYLATVGRHSQLGCVRAKLQAYLLVSDAALSGFISGGKSLDDSKTLEENDIILPGPAARRRGEKIELFFELSGIVLRQEHEEAEKAMKAQMLLESRNMEKKLREEQLAQKKREDDLFWTGGAAEENLREYCEKHIGIPRSLSVAMKASDPDFEEPSNFLEPCTEAQILALECLLQGTGLGTAKVVMAMRNDNAELQERFERSKYSLSGPECRIKKRTSATLKVMQKNSSVEAALGECDRNLNEFLLFHGTPKVEAVFNICKSGFDIHYVGTTTDAGWYGAGFYFADAAQLSSGYGRNSVHVNAKYSACHILLVNRVVIGNVMEVNHVVDDDERMRFTAECLGPGGVFGPGAKFHSVLGGNATEYVCMSSRQIYPEFVVLYTF